MELINVSIWLKHINWEIFDNSLKNLMIKVKDSIIWSIQNTGSWDNSLIVRADGS